MGWLPIYIKSIRFQRIGSNCDSMQCSPESQIQYFAWKFIWPEIVKNLPRNFFEISPGYEKLEYLLVVVAITIIAINDICDNLATFKFSELPLPFAIFVE